MRRQSIIVIWMIKINKKITIIMNFGHCKHCWWWKKTTPVADKGYCFFHRNTTKETTYCCDYYNRKNGNKEDGKLDEWISKHPEIRITEEEL